jgi:hypothetical protein
MMLTVLQITKFNFFYKPKTCYNTVPKQIILVVKKQMPANHYYICKTTLP